MKKDTVPADFRVIDEDDAILVVDKPAQLLVHPSKPDGPPTLWHGLRALLAYELSTGGQISIINRLDRETSGLTLVAKSSLAARHLGRAMMRREIKKEYLALVRGWPEEDSFTINAPLLREGDVHYCPIYVRQCVHPDGRESVTRVMVEKRLARPDGFKFALVRAFPETGRMHQIRVHLAHAGHVLIGDKIYTGQGEDYLLFMEEGWSEAMERRLLMDRHALHSAAISVGERRWECPLPPDMAAWI
jgi:23S rRNA pseudouridine1911/1915/1917 synthase